MSGPFWSESKEFDGIIVPVAGTFEPLGTLRGLEGRDYLVVRINDQTTPTLCPLVAPKRQGWP